MKKAKSKVGSSVAVCHKEVAEIVKAWPTMVESALQLAKIATVGRLDIVELKSILKDVVAVVGNVARQQAEMRTELESLKQGFADLSTGTLGLAQSHAALLARSQALQAYLRITGRVSVEEITRLENLLAAQAG
ncbi:MAG TPA: hypothetical protein VGM05_13090 [Planctomycetaceae bacterium]|jgi:hypothetical protein